MRRVRFSLRGLMIVIVLLGVGIRRAAIADAALGQSLVLPALVGC